MEEIIDEDVEREELGKYADLFPPDTSKPVRLSLHLIVKRHLPAEAKEWSQEKIFEAIHKIGHLRLDRENILAIDGLELLGDKLTNIYLQHNHIKRIENLDCLKNLQFITLSGNQIQTVENLNDLQKLLFLDLSFNLINAFDIDEFPQSLIILNLKGNPCTSHPDHRGRIIQDLPKLQQLDEVDISKEEKLEAGFVQSDDEEDENDSTKEDDTKEATRRSTNSIDITSMTNSALVRSQQRLEQDLKGHMKHFEELDRLREKYNILTPIRTSETSKKPK